LPQDLLTDDEDIENINSENEKRMDGSSDSEPEDD